MSRSSRDRAGDKPRNASQQVVAGTRRQPGKGLSERARWITGAVLVAGVVAWWAISTLGGQEGRSAPRPIATFTASDVHSLLIDPTDPDRVLFGSHAGVQESLDGGFTWQAGSLSNADAMSMAVSPAEAAIRYVAGHDVFLVSRDGGESWQPVAHDLPGTDLHAFAQDPTDSRRLYTLVAGAGVFTSADEGRSWTPLPTQPPGMSGQGALATDGATLYAVTPSGLFRSTDGGTTWAVTVTQPADLVVSLAVPATTAETIYAGTTSGVAKSTDGGATWIELGPSDAAVPALATAPADPNRLMIVDETGAVYRSDDGGTTWLAPR